MMNSDQTNDGLSFKLERVHAIADILLTIIYDNPKAQILTQIIMETSLQN